MAQDLTVNIKTTSDVPQAMDKAKSATVSFSKQVEDIQKKFSTAFKDIFLGFTAPMILIQSAISYISAQMEQARRDAKEGLDLIAQGETKFATSQEAKTAAFFKRRKELEEERRLVEAGRASLTEQILNDPELAKGFVLPPRIMQRLQSGESVKGVSKDPELGRMTMDYLTQTEKGRKILAEGTPIESGKQAKFEGLQGFSNVVGVGKNAALEVITAQLEEQRKQTALLQQIASPIGVVPQDFTKENGVSAPSRAGLLFNK
jgi:hypothetical protein